MTLIEHAGAARTKSEWARYAGLDIRTFHARLSRGESLPEALRPVEPLLARKPRSRIDVIRMFIAERCSDSEIVAFLECGLSEVHSLRSRT